jgi:hypothetical protein
MEPLKLIHKKLSLRSIRIIRRWDVYLENDAIRRVWVAGKEKERVEVVERATKERRERVTDLTPKDAIGGTEEGSR